MRTRSVCGGAGPAGRRGGCLAVAALCVMSAAGPGGALHAQEALIDLAGRVVGILPAGSPGAAAPLGAIRYLPSGEASAGGRTIRYPAGTYILRGPGVPADATFSRADILFRDGTLQYLPLKEFDLGDLETGDVNGDGRPDIAFSIARNDCDSIPGTVPRLWIQNSQNRFFDETAARMPAASTSTFDIDLFDAEGDGDLDILLGGYNCTPARSVMTLLINDGTGVFTDETLQRIVAVPEFHILSFAEPARIDSDRYTDIVAVMQDLTIPQAPVSIPLLLMNTGDGHFWPDTAGRLNPAGAYGYFNVEAADLTGDSLTDLLFLNIASPGEGLAGQPALFRNTGNGFMTDESAARLGGEEGDTLRSSRDAAIGDVDGDGDPDILDVGWFSASNVPQVRLLRNNGAGFFSPDTGGAIGGLSAWFNDAEFAPIAQDSVPDLFMARIQVGGTATDLLLLNEGSGSFRDSSALLPSVSDFTTAAAVCDYDEDGDFDVMTGNSSPVVDRAGQNRLYINQRYSPPSGVGGDGGAPRSTSLLQNYPNPFNPSTVIAYTLGTGASVTVTAVNVLGVEVLRSALGYQPPGRYEFLWNAAGLPAGVYFYTVTAGGERLAPLAAVLVK